MVVKKSGGKIIGAHLTAAEQKAMNMEILRQIAAMNEKNADEIDAMILWHLFDEFGFDEEDLKQFHHSFYPKIKELSERYEMADTDRAWLCTYKLKEKGIDIAAWNREIEREVSTG